VLEHRYTAPMPVTRVERAILAVGAAGYAALVIAGTWSRSPRAWAFHLPGFLPVALRIAVVALLTLGAAWLVLDWMRGASVVKERSGHGPPVQTHRRGRPKAGGRDRGRSGRSPAKARHVPEWSGVLLLILWAALLWILRARSLFLGDGTVWLETLRTGHPYFHSEPLSAWLWFAYCSILRAGHIPIEASTAGVFSIVCGVLAAAVLWGIASEIAPKPRDRAVPFALLLTLGSSQLFFGYIESYPPAAVLILAYLWLAMRLARDVSHPALVGAVLACTVASHLATVFLVPSYVYLILRRRRSVPAQAGLVLLPLLGAAGVMLLIGYPPDQWLGAFQIAARAVRPGQGAASLAKPYGALSIDHAWDLTNAIFLVLPIPFVALAARALGARFGAPPRKPNPAGAESDAPRARDPRVVALALSASLGLCLAIALVLPIPPAQDWDLTSLFLMPLAVLAVMVTASPDHPLLGGKRGGAVLLMGTGALLAFVAVNASEAAGISRFETIVGPGAKITAFGRAYGNEALATHFSDRGDFARAVVYAERARAAEPTNPRYWTKEGAALYELKRYDEAIDRFQESIRRAPRDDAYYNLGNALVQTGRFEEAASSFQEAVRRAEPRPDYMHNLGVALYRAGKEDSAKAVWATVVRRWPDYQRSLRSLALHFGPAAADSIRAGLNQP
jgi:tetratricopeptide (TPR) repeat protein